MQKFEQRESPEQQESPGQGESPAQPKSPKQQEAPHNQQNIHKSWNTLRYGVLILLMLAYIHSFFTRQLVSVTAVDLREAFQLTNLQIGLLYGTFFSIFYAVAGIPMGRLADRTSRKRMILLGLTIWSTATILTGFAATFTVLILLRILLGLSQAMLSPAVYSFLADYAPPKKRATAFSVYAAGIFIGVGLSFLIGGEITQTTGWREAFKGSGLMGLLFVPVLLLFLREPTIRSKHYPGSGVSVATEIRRIILIPSVRWHLTGFAALACTGYTVLAFAGILLTDPFTLPASAESITEAATVASTSASTGISASTSVHPPDVRLIGWFILMISATVFLSGKFADKLASKNPAHRYYSGIIAALGGLPFYAVGFFTSNPTLALTGMGTGLLISSSYNGTAAAIIQSYVKKGQRALTGGLYLFVISIAGFAIGPPTAGFLMDTVYSGPHASGKAVFTVMIFCSLVAIFAFRKAISSHNNDIVEK